MGIIEAQTNPKGTKKQNKKGKKKVMTGARWEGVNPPSPAL